MTGRARPLAERVARAREVHVRPHDRPEELGRLFRLGLVEMRGDGWVGFRCGCATDGERYGLSVDCRLGLHGCWSAPVVVVAHARKREAQRARARALMVAAGHLPLLPVVRS